MPDLPKTTSSAPLLTLGIIFIIAGFAVDLTTLWIAGLAFLLTGISTWTVEHKEDHHQPDGHRRVGGRYE